VKKKIVLYFVEANKSLLKIYVVQLHGSTRLGAGRLARAFSHQSV